MNVGFVGVGRMGAAMIPNLIKAGHHVAAWNRDPAAVRKLAQVTVLDSPGDAFQTDAVITMLSDDSAVRSVLVDSGAFTSASKSCVHVMMATISPALSGELEELHRKADVGYVAATVFGIPAIAAKGELNIMAAGKAASVAKVQPLLDALGQKTWHLGESPQHANVAKVAGNMMITFAIEAMGEATALTESYGLKASDFLDIVTNTMFACPSYKRYGENIAKGTYEPGFKLTLGLKDVNLALDAAKAKETSLPTAEIVRRNMEHAVKAGLGDKDWSALARTARLNSGLREDIA